MKFSVPKDGVGVDKHVERLGEAGCDDALIGVDCVLRFSGIGFRVLLPGCMWLACFFQPAILGSVLGTNQ